jgi:hypothetical protein
VLATEIGGGDRAQPFLWPVTDEIAQPQLVETARRVDQDVTAFLQAGEDIDLVQQGRILDDQCIGFHDRFAQPDFLVGDTAERDDRGSSTLGTETREGLGVAAFLKRSNRQHLGSRNHALAAATVYSDLEHVSSIVFNFLLTPAQDNLLLTN